MDTVSAKLASKCATTSSALDVPNLPCFSHLYEHKEAWSTQLMTEERGKRRAKKKVQLRVYFYLSSRNAPEHGFHHADLATVGVVYFPLDGNTGNGQKQGHFCSCRHSSRCWCWCGCFRFLSCGMFAAAKKQNKSIRPRTSTPMDVHGARIVCVVCTINCNDLLWLKNIVKKQSQPIPWIELHSKQ